MLPFLKPKRDGVQGTVVIERKPDNPDDIAPGDSAAEAAAEDIIRAIETKDSKHLALALRAAFEIFDSQPHVEGPHEEGEE